MPAAAGAPDHFGVAQLDANALGCSGSDTKGAGESGCGVGGAGRRLDVGAETTGAQDRPGRGGPGDGLCPSVLRA